MAVLRIEHAVKDYDTWKSVFDRDPIDRKGSGVRRYAVHRPVDDPAYVLIDLEFDDAGTAEKFLGRLQTEVWPSANAAAAIASPPQARVVETADSG